eukprot:TRINITY_DN10849_c0_g2_i1.p1 TRINITY_DN10849_c0_g2~~TRINITY_DN10849_c0_g2_i1.p1  ORF type:complete len:353 (-),score=24.68 TRINITY_DN10849_c0_g2_i1:169-1227(-)
MYLSPLTMGGKYSSQQPAAEYELPVYVQTYPDGAYRGSPPPRNVEPIRARVRSDWTIGRLKSDLSMRTDIPAREMNIAIPGRDPDSFNDTTPLRYFDWQTLACVGISVSGTAAAVNRSRLRPPSANTSHVGSSAGRSHTDRDGYSHAGRSRGSVGGDDRAGSAAFARGTPPSAWGGAPRHTSGAGHPLRPSSGGFGETANDPRVAGSGRPPPRGQGGYADAAEPSRGGDAPDGGGSDAYDGKRVSTALALLTSVDKALTELAEEVVDLERRHSGEAGDGEPPAGWFSVAGPLSERLTRQLLRLDELQPTAPIGQCAASDDLRAARRGLVGRIQGLCDRVEVVCPRVKDMRTY